MFLLHELCMLINETPIGRTVGVRKANFEAEANANFTLPEKGASPTERETEAHYNINRKRPKKVI